ncbi:MAG TPA: hypothetical protein DCR04_11240 [Flavobacteriales bacterium]|nr:hypothetical protein [Flavobacteriales bacterium]
MKIILLILFLSFSSFSVAEANAKEWETSKELHEKLCDAMSEDIYDLYMLQQKHWSLITVLRESRRRNKELSKKVFGHDDMSDVMERDWLEFYETTVLSIFDSFSIIDDGPELYKNASKIRDTEFAECYKQLVLEK